MLRSRRRVGSERWAVLASASRAHSVVSEMPKAVGATALMGGELQGTDDLCCRVSFFVTVRSEVHYARAATAKKQSQQAELAV